MNLVALAIHGLSAISVYVDVIFVRLLLGSAAVNRSRNHRHPFLRWLQTLYRLSDAGLDHDCNLHLCYRNITSKHFHGGHDADAAWRAVQLHHRASTRLAAIR